MNKVILIGRLVRDPEVRYTAGENATCIVRYTLAVDRRFRRANDANEKNADFIGCVVFGKPAEFAEKYFKKGTKIAVTGRIQTSNYTNKEGVKVYSTEVVIEDQEFAEGKSVDGNNNNGNNSGSGYSPRTTGRSPEKFMSIPDGVDEELPFN